VAASPPNKPIILVGHIKVELDELPEEIVRALARGWFEGSHVSQGVEISDDPALIFWTRQAFEKDLDARCAWAIAGARAGGRLTLAYLDALKQRPGPAGEELRRILRDDQAPAKGKVRAAQLLVGLKRLEGEEFLVAALESPSTDLCAEALEALADFGIRVDLARPTVAAAALKLLSSPNPDLVKKVARLCTYHDVPGAEAALREAVARGREPIDDLATALARCATTPESVQTALPYLFRQRQKTFNFSAYTTLRRVIHHPDPAVSRPLREAMQRYLLAHEGRDRLGQHWAGDLAAVADQTVVPVLEHIVANSRDPVARASALDALGRLRPEGAVERILNEMRFHKPWNRLFDLLGRHANERNFGSICDVLYPQPSGQRERPICMEEARLLLEKLGQPGRELLTRNRARLGVYALPWVAWKLLGLDVRTALAELHAAGVIPQPPQELLRLLIRPLHGVEPPYIMSPPGLLTQALELAGVVTTVDVESGQVPCRHEDLVRRFAANSCGRFTPECPVQMWYREDEEDRDTPYLVQFIHRGKLYRFVASNSHLDYYDVAAVVGGINAALERDGHPERYLVLQPDGQSTWFVFADPAAFLPIAERYFLPAAGVRRTARALDERVFGIP
jgi:HEAT repeat protein